tara:strand:+ start:7946 stop:8377 length:432 start_codon:yes stop_codon:yes gene_type:complete
MQKLIGINYQKILKKNMLNVLKDILKEISKNGLTNNNLIYITFLTNHKEVELPKWLKDKYPNDITIVIQYEYYNLVVDKNSFSLNLSFNNKRTNLIVGFDSVISFADPSANFGLKIKDNKNLNKEKKTKIKNNVIDFSNFKKN